MRRGTTLVELLIVLGIVAVLAATTIPSAAGLLAMVQTEWAARELMAAHRIARFTAIQRGEPALLLASPDSLIVRCLSGGDTVIVWRAPGPRERGVSLSGPDYPLVFNSTGIPRGVANATYNLQRGVTQRHVIVSRLGRLRLAR